MALALSRSPPDTGPVSEGGHGGAAVGEARRAERRRVGRGTWQHAGHLWRSCCPRAGDMWGGSSTLAWGQAAIGWLRRSVPGEAMHAATCPLSQSLEATGVVAQIGSGRGGDFSA
jgi:hypothetical protein